MKNIRNLLVIVTAGLFLITGCSSDDDVRGSGNLTSEVRELSSFSAIDNEGVIDLVILVGEAQSVEIIGDDNVLRYVETRVEDNELKIRLEDGRNYNNIDLEAIISLPSLRRLRNEGVSQVQIDNVNSGSSFEVENEGSGNIRISGETSRFELENHGSGDIMAFGLSTQTSKVDLEGSGDVELTCSDVLEVEIEGSGNVYYRGSPEIISEIQGSGAVIDAN
ncbi:putative autotransporter adhesin-like protein [Christiangramia gaetbulicola]|uniref:Putative autotransporter adhesin-like protein n=1 Tax=Christiangramia gaetbulicola TaxID=703340 RepID=A0A2T6AIH1_9FLAO|nr:head GIN domain-containing protein [Christiangramia gaetbulicola]PTX43618.1 putative autotransporter adhesin-like protein [Christiangramia gaetbulicola]